MEEGKETAHREIPAVHDLALQPDEERLTILVEGGEQGSSE
jgi:hypothetical protein